MTRNNNISVIPFYPSVEEQDFRKWWAYGEIYPFCVPGDYLVPFFFTLPYTGDDPHPRSIVSVNLYQHTDCGDDNQTLGSFDLSFDNSFDSGGEIIEYLSDLEDNGLSLIHDATNNVDMILYTADAVTDLALKRGYYYLKIEFNDYTVMYSDIFVVGDLRNKVKIEWYCKDDLFYEGGYIPYGTASGDAFKNILYVDTEVAMPTYNTSEEGTDRDGYFFAIKQLSWKTYNMAFHAPEYMCDCLRLAFLADRVKVTDQLGREYQCDTFNMEVNWLDQGHYASVSCSFNTDTVVKIVGKAYSTISDR